MRKALHFRIEIYGKEVQNVCITLFAKLERHNRVHLEHFFLYNNKQTSITPTRKK